MKAIATAAALTAVLHVALCLQHQVTVLVRATSWLNHLIVFFYHELELTITGSLTMVVYSKPTLWWWVSISHFQQRASTS